MAFRPEGSNNKKKQSQEEEYDELKGAAVAIAAVAGVAGLAAWGISKLLGGNSEEKPLSESQHTNYRQIEQPLFRQYPSRQSPEQSSVLKWTKPKYGWCKLNTDASLKGEEYDVERGEASGAGVIRDHTGKWMVGFTVKLGVCDINSAEMQALREGLQFAWDRDFRKIEVETDSEQVLNYIEIPNYVKKNPEKHYLAGIIKECRGLINSNWDGIEICHVKNDRNKCADLMAKMGRNESRSFAVWESPPNDKIRGRVSIDQNE